MKLSVPISDTEWDQLHTYYKKYGCIDHAHSNRQYLPKGLVAILRRLAKHVHEIEVQTFKFEGITIERKGSIYILTRPDNLVIKIDMEKYNPDRLSGISLRVRMIKWIYDTIKLEETTDTPNRLKLSKTLYENFTPNRDDDSTRY